jgi:hypothetical protein
MKLSIVIIGLVLIAIYMVPAVILARLGLKSKKRLIKELIELAEQSNCHLSEHNYWNNTAIGIDQEHPNLFYINKTTNNERTIRINLSEVQTCQIVRKSKNPGKKSHSSSAIEKLGLVFTFIEKNKPDLFLEFFNTDFDDSISNEYLEQAEKWSGIVNDATARLTPGP